MVQFIATMHRFEKQGEKTGWTYIEIPRDIAQKLKPGNKKSFRVKGKLDSHKIAGVSLLPMGGGSFIMAINAAMRKGIGKKHGAMVSVQLVEDKKPYELNTDLMECLRDEPKAQRTGLVTKQPEHASIVVDVIAGFLPCEPAPTATAPLAT